MKKPNVKKREGNAIDFWQSATDLSLVFALILLLTTGVLILYVFQLPEEYRHYIWGTEEDVRYDGEEYSHVDGNEYEYYGDEHDDNEHDDNDSDGGDGDGEEEDDYHELYPTPSNGGDEWHKAAVYVTVIDAETLRAIREPELYFELYENFTTGSIDDVENLNGAIRYLYTYYPEKIEFRSYKTREDGTFYLPEKILEGEYYFKEITEPEGYDAAGSVAFDIDEPYDWSDPYVVSIPLYPSKNVIRVALKDADTGEWLTSGSFNVNAADVISTIDGTVRFKRDELADVIEITGDMLGISDELYLGKYQVTQNTTPDFYTTADEVVTTTVEKKDGSDVQIIEFACQKTAITVHVSDDVTYKGVAGARFNLCLDDGTVCQSLQTDTNGEVTFTNLDKNTSYHLKQTASAEGYELDTETRVIYVDATGRIDGKANANVDITNFIPRVEIQLCDILTRSRIRGTKLSLYDVNNNLICSWVTSDTDEDVTGLGVGEYSIQVGNRSVRHDFMVNDSHRISQVVIETWSQQSILTIIGGGVLIPLSIYLIILFTSKRARKKRNKQNS